MNLFFFAIFHCNLDIFLIWKNIVLQMLEMCLLNDRFLSNSTPRFLTEDHNLNPNHSSRDTLYSLLLHLEVFGPVIKQ